MIPEIRANGKRIKEDIGDQIRGLLFEISPHAIANRIMWRIDEFRRGLKENLQDGKEWLVEGYKVYEHVRIRIEGIVYIYTIQRVQKEQDGTFKYDVKWSSRNGGNGIPSGVPYKLENVSHSGIEGKA